MYNAPSTKYRMKYYLEVRGIEKVNLNEYFMRVIKIIYRFFFENKNYIVIMLFLIVVYLVLNVKQNKKVKISENMILLIASTVSCGALVMSPYIETRAFFINDFFMLTCILFYVEEIHSLLDINLRKVFLYIGVCMILLSATEGIKIYNVYKEYWNYCNVRELAIEKLGGDMVYNFEQYPRPYNSRVLTTRENWLSENYAVLSEYYGIEIN